MLKSVAKRSPPPSMEDAVRVIETQPFTTPSVISVLLKMSMPMTYAAIADGSIPSTRVGSKLRIPCAPYRDLMSTKLLSMAPVERVAA